MDPTLLHPKSDRPLLADNFARQDNVFHHAFGLVEDAVAAKAFPACSVAVSHRGEVVARKAFGRFTYEANSKEVNSETIFDIASLTKVVATTAAAMVLYERGLLDLKVPVASVLPEFAPEFLSAESTDSESRAKVTPHMLLAHTSGLPAHKKFYLDSANRDELLRAAFATPLSSAPGMRAEYSDIGFIILGVMLERLADESLDAFCQREVFGVLGMAHTTFNPSRALKNSIAPTALERDRNFSDRIVQGEIRQRNLQQSEIRQGEVQDDNARVLGGVAGHAGLFSTADDLALFAHAMLGGGHPIVRSSTVEFFSRRETAPEGTSRALGWDTPSAPSQSGKYFSARSFGHLGYTGTSLWIDPERQVSIVMLTNRTWPDCTNNVIKRVRPAFHDSVMEALGIAA